MNLNTKRNRHQKAAIIGVVLMGTGSFLACLSFDRMWSNIGSGLLIISILLMIYGFSRWQP